MTNSNDDTAFDEDVDMAFDKDWPTKIKWECSPDSACGRLTCAACSDPQRLRWIRQTLAITKAHPGQHEIATIVLLPIPMLLMDAKILRGVLRDVLGRVDFQGALLRGGFDVIWDSAHNSWILCAHVLAVDVPPGAWARLRALLRNAKPEWAEPNYFDASYFRPNFLVKVQHLHDPEKQIAGLVKFPTYFWPRSPTGAARAETLPAGDPATLADWASDHTFKDFTFQFGKATARKSSLCSS